MGVSSQGGIEFYGPGANHGPDDEVGLVGWSHDGIGYTPRKDNPHEINLGILSLDELLAVEAGLKGELDRLINRLNGVPSEEKERLAASIEQYSRLFHEARNRIPEPDSLKDAKAVPSDNKVYPA